MAKTFPGAVAQRENGKAHVRVRSFVRYPPFVVGAYLRPLPRSHCVLAYSVVQNRATTFALDCVNSRSTTGRNFDVKFTQPKAYLTVEYHECNSDKTLGLTILLVEATYEL